MNKAFNPNPPKGAALTDFFYSHMRSDWRVIRTLFEISPDDIATMMHKCMGILYSATPFAAALVTSNNRDTWEMETDKSGIKALLCAPDITEKLQAIMNEEFGKKNEDESEDTGEFIMELMETYDITKIPSADRQQKVQALWAHRPKFTISKFEAKLLAPDAKAKYALLAEFMEKEERLRGLKHLPSILEWLNLLSTHYGRRLTKKRAKEVTVADIIEEQPEDSRAHWEDAFAGFAAGWNSTWAQVKRFGCLQIENMPEDIRNLVMDRNKMICYSCVHQDEDEGILVGALINFMCTSHNDMVRLIDQTMLLSNRHEHRDAIQNPVLPLAECLPAHMLEYDFAGSFMPLIEKQCVEFLQGGGVNFDFETAQQYLLNRWLCKPEIDAVIGNFQYLEEQAAKNALKQLGKLITQVPLPKQLEKAVQADITSPIEAQKCIDALSTCVSFLKGTPKETLQSGQEAPKDEKLAQMPVGQYAMETLKMDSNAFISKTVANQVLLCHLDGLWQLLLGTINPDPTEEVNPAYTSDLSPEQKQKLLSVAGTFDEGFLECMGDWMKAYLSGSVSMKKDDALSTSFGYNYLDDVQLLEFDWFQNTFDQSFLLEHIVSIYRTIRDSQ